LRRSLPFWILVDDALQVLGEVLVIRPPIESGGN
jgi:hypothetical protein